MSAFGKMLKLTALVFELAPIGSDLKITLDFGAEAVQNLYMDLMQDREFVCNHPPIKMSRDEDGNLFFVIMLFKVEVTIK